MIKSIKELDGKNEAYLRRLELELLFKIYQELKKVNKPPKTTKTKKVVK